MKKNRFMPSADIFVSLKTILFFLVILLFSSSTTEAFYVSRYNTTTNGAMSWTGNTLGLSKVFNQNNPGTNGSIGAFTSLNSLLQVGTYPAGTTLDWTLNGSNAILDLPPGSTVLYAELIWSGSFGFDPLITGAVLNTPVTLTTPDSISHTVTRDPATAQSILLNGGPGGIYVRTANVTSLVTAGGTYSVSGVPATVVASENNLNCAGWTLAVVYSNPAMFTSNLSLFVGLQGSNSATSTLTGFQSPTTGTFTSRIFLSAVEGDADIVGDHFLVGATAPLSYPANAIFGSGNPSNNFFGSQINTLLNLTQDIVSGKFISSGPSLLDTRGSFGLFNQDSNTSTNISGGRQGYDITSLDLGSIITNGQTQLVTQPTTNGDAFTINGLGIQIQVTAPVIQAVKQVSPTTGVLNTVVTFTSTFTNIGQSDAASLVFTDILATGLTYVPGSFTIDGVPFVNPDLNNGVPIGNLTVGSTVTIVFDAQITAINPPTSYDNFATVNYTFNPFNDPNPVPVSAQTNTVTVSTPAVAPPVAVDDTGSTSANTVLNGTSLLANDTGTAITVTSFTAPAQAGSSVNVQPDGTYTYTPATGFSGIDFFTYTITDSLNQSDTAVVTVTVFPLAQADTGTVAANTPLNQVISVLSNDAGSGLSVTAYDAVSMDGGTVVMQPTGTYLYTPALNFSGVDSFNYTITDSTGNTSSTVVTIFVLPAAANDFGTTPANTTLNGSTVFSNDIGTGLTIIAYDSVSTQGGTVTMNTLTGTYVYVPPPNFSGIDTFTYTVQDSGGNTTVATVTITVLPVAVNDTGTTTANVILNGTSVLANDLGSGLSVFSYTPVTVQGGTVVVNNLTGTYLYAPPNNFSGIDTFTYIAQDSSGGTSQGLVTITVLPTAAVQNETTPADTPLNGPSVLNETVGTGVTVVGYQSTSDAGGNIFMDLSTGTYVYTPPPGYSGPDSFVYFIQDSAGSNAVGRVNITVTPVTLPLIISTSENTPVTGPSVLNYGVGTDLSVVSYESTSVSGGTITMNLLTGIFTYSPPLDFSGQDSFTYTLRDAFGNEAIGLVLINVLATPQKFIGKLVKYEFLNKTEYRLKAKWKSAGENVRYYRIYYKNRLVAQFDSDDSHLVYKKTLKSKRSAYLYSLAFVYGNNTESSRIKIRIVHE